MERQRSYTSTSFHLLSSKCLLLLSFASSSLLFSLIFSLFALRLGSPFRLPFVANGSVVVGQVLAAGGSRSAAAVEAAVLAGGSGSLGGDSAVRVARHGHAGAGGLPSLRGVGSAMEVNEAALGGENGETPANGEVLEGRDIAAEAGEDSLIGSDSDIGVEGAAAGDGEGEKLAKDTVFEEPSSAEGENTSKEVADSTLETPLIVGNASASNGAAAPVEKSEKVVELQAVNSSMEDSGPAMGQKGEFLQGGRAGGNVNSTAKYSSGAAPINTSIQDTDQIQETVTSKIDAAGSNAAPCDVYDGRWVLDESYPLYSSKLCPFIDEGFSCEANGRMDRSYRKWRWQPRHCSIPRFDARKMLEMLRGKRLVFVGDSINRNQWESMMCLLTEAVSNPARIHEARGRRITKERGDYNFKFLDYNCSVEYHVTHFLVHEGKARIGQKRTRTLRIDTIDRGSSKWRGADVLVFNTAHWWSHHKTKAGLNYYQEGDHVHPHFDASTAFHRALTTWASWVDRYIDPRKAQVFFRGSSPSHFSGGEWNSGGHCRESTLPLNDTHARPVPARNSILEQVVQQMKTPVTVLNITYLSGIRIDGHPSVYGRKAIGPTAGSIQDCSHWCLPGVPDTWNELLFYHLVSKEKDVTS